MFGNENGYGGYKPQDLYVCNKYQTFKEEILVHLPIKTYKTLILNKAKEYMKSERTRSLRANDADILLHYGISKGTPINIDNIMSIILYCDLSKYSTRFSENLIYYSYQKLKIKSSETVFRSKLKK